MSACQTNCRSNLTGLTVIPTALELRDEQVGECAETAIALGLSAEGDGFGGAYYYDAASALADNGTTVLRSDFGGAWIKLF